MACVLLGELASSPFLWLGIEGVLCAGRWVTVAGRFLCGHDDQVVGGCLVTHVLLPTLVLLWRAELAEVIGEALLQCTARERAPARWLPRPGVPMATLQAWCRRLARRAIDTRTHLGTLAHRWYPEHGEVDGRWARRLTGRSLPMRRRQPDLETEHVHPVSTDTGKSHPREQSVSNWQRRCCIIANRARLSELRSWSGRRDTI
jgi:hypothetical protein